MGELQNVLHGTQPIPSEPPLVEAKMANQPASGGDYTGLIRFLGGTALVLWGIKKLIDYEQQHPGVFKLQSGPTTTPLKTPSPSESPRMKSTPFADRSFAGSETVVFVLKLVAPRRRFVAQVASLSAENRRPHRTSQPQAKQPLGGDLRRPCREST